MTQGGIQIPGVLDEEAIGLLGELERAEYRPRDVSQAAPASSYARGSAQRDGAVAKMSRRRGRWWNCSSTQNTYPARSTVPVGRPGLNTRPQHPRPRPVARDVRAVAQTLQQQHGDPLVHGVVVFEEQFVGRRHGLRHQPVGAVGWSDEHLHRFVVQDASTASATQAA